MRTIAAFLALGLVAVAGARPAEAGTGNACQFLPVVIDVEASGTRYRTEVSFTNPNRDVQEIAVLYTPSLGRVEGAGEGRFSIPGGQQVLVLDAIEFLRGLGIGIPPYEPGIPQGGTLRICSLTTGGAPIGVMARITSPTRPPYPAGNSGVSFAAVPADEGFTSRATVFGYRQNLSDRTNIAIYNPGADPVSLKVTLVSGSSNRQVVLSEREELAGYGWKQFTNPAVRESFIDEGYVLVERTSTSGVFGAYGVVNDNDTNDGSFIPAVAEGDLRTSWVIPVLVDSLNYRSELILANPGIVDATFHLGFSDSVSRQGVALSATVFVPGRRQVIVPDVFGLFQAQASTGEVPTRAGTLRVQVLEEQAHGAFVGVRVLTRQERGRFGVFAPVVPPEAAEAGQGFLWGLRSDAQTRSNVAVLNANASTGETITLQLQVFDGAGGRPAGAPLTVTLAPGQWAQPDGFFARSGATRGDVRIVRVSGTGPWWAYGIVNDGSAPGEGTGDGSFVPIVFSGALATLTEGAWGGTGIRMWVDESGAAIETDCSHGKIEGPIFLDAQGRFNAEGTFSFEGGPTPENGFFVHRVLYSGVVEKGQMSLSIRFVMLTASQEVRLTATQGVSGQLTKCL